MINEMNLSRLVSKTLLSWSGINPWSQKHVSDFRVRSDGHILVAGTSSPYDGK